MIAPGQLDRVVTDRLTGEPLGRDHLDELCPLLLDDRVWPTLWAQRTRPSRDDVVRQLAYMSAHWRRHGFGLWLLRDRATGEAIGRGGLEMTRARGRDEVEVAWMIAADRWGRGLATELAQVALHLAMTRLRLAEVVALTLPHNTASRRVMEKCGFQLVGDITYGGLPHVLYRRKLTVGA